MTEAQITELAEAVRWYGAAKYEYGLAVGRGDSRATKLGRLAANEAFTDLLVLLEALS